MAVVLQHHECRGHPCGGTSADRGGSKASVEKEAVGAQGDVSRSREPDQQPTSPRSGGGGKRGKNHCASKTVVDTIGPAREGQLGASAVIANGDRGGFPAH